MAKVLRGGKWGNVSLGSSRSRPCSEKPPTPSGTASQPPISAADGASPIADDDDVDDGTRFHHRLRGASLRQVSVPARELLFS